MAEHALAIAVMGRNLRIRFGGTDILRGDQVSKGLLKGLRKMRKHPIVGFDLGHEAAVFSGTLEGCNRIAKCGSLRNGQAKAVCLPAIQAIPVFGPSLATWAPAWKETAGSGSIDADDPVAARRNQHFLFKWAGSPVKLQGHFG
jgi:hypothetical protein